MLTRHITSCDSTVGVSEVSEVFVVDLVKTAVQPGLAPVGWRADLEGCRATSTGSGSSS
eukprot:CAMPEP_0180517712 /NCGR_PEP_ID=MMETSP1036_2-20121128/54683_1 /TAXON_ID=632150 /ORGANISM="Azadinium spinosum, Strain 3D9" /LENGTH=58 /DNA_ID=CAMNT_0022529767 /DNA_START=84 /DNA_END=257 /DNA_ORIENTATION=+